MEKRWMESFEGCPWGRCRSGGRCGTPLYNCSTQAATAWGYGGGTGGENIPAPLLGVHQDEILQEQ